MKQYNDKAALASTAFASAESGAQSYILIAQNSLRILDKPTLGECWLIENSVGVHIQETYSRLKGLDKALYVKNLRRAFELAEEAKALASQMTREEAIAAIKAGCEANKSLGWTAEEGLIDPTGWYEARLEMFDDSDAIGVYIVEHAPFWEAAYSGWQELVPSGIGCQTYGSDRFAPVEPSIDIVIFTRMVAGLIKLAPNGETVHIDMDDNNAYYTKVGDAIEAELEKLSDRELAVIWYNYHPIMLDGYMLSRIVENVFNKTYDDKLGIDKNDFMSFIYRMRALVASKRQGFSYEDGSPFLKDIFAEEYTSVKDALKPLINKRFDEYFSADYAENKEYWDDMSLPNSHEMALEQMREAAKNFVINSDEGLEIIRAHKPEEINDYEWTNSFE